MELRDYEGPEQPGLAVKNLDLHPGESVSVNIKNHDGEFLRRIDITLTKDLEYEVAEHSEACQHGCPPPLQAGKFHKPGEKPAPKGPRMEIFTMDGKGNIKPLDNDLFDLMEQLFGPAKPH